ncbi:MAG: poly-gamma-glutamate synthase PgsB [Bacteroidetes bacterium]|nr:poly-gamma-glutamate synthase PgsB [Bacteroidota bacterium]MCW5896654.1 poly-gamma-glutamate synthase PgsB [Bacteroidota bacterium]
MHSAYILLPILAIIFCYWLVEYSQHQRRVHTIPIRVHVNGTRGKSSVTRLIGAGLRAGGISTLTKVTGTYPRLILEDGSDVHIHRWGEANIREQISIVRFASERKAQALVIECMALEQQFQRITEQQMIHATIGVITNVRLDHIDIMGRTLPEIAAVLAETIPEEGEFFTGETNIPKELEKHAKGKNAAMHLTNEQSVTSDEMRGFSYIEHRENVALALAVCQHLGVPRDVALNGMYSAIPDAGALRRFRVEAFGKRLTFYNAFAANDPDSTLLVWKRLKEETGLDGTRIVLLNTRQDRMDRARQLTELAGRKLTPDMEYLMLIGNNTDVVKHMAMGYGVPQEKILSIGWAPPETVFEKALAATQRASTIVAIGNMGGMGGKVAEYFEHRSFAAYD